MRGTFHRHLAAAAIVLAASGAAFAQSETKPEAEQTPPAADAATAAPESTPSAAPETTPSSTAVTQPGTTAAPPAAPVELSQAPLAANLSAADTAAAEQIRALLATRLSRVIDRRQDRAGVEAFYRDRGFAPLWVADGAASPRARQAAAFLKTVDRDGLEPSDYAVPEFKGADKLAQDEIALTNTILTLARHARTGRVSYSRVSASIHYDLEYPEAANVLANVANAGDLSDALNSYFPQHKSYQALKAKLAQARAQKAATVDAILANMERWRWMPRDLGKTHVVVNIPDFTLKVMNDGKQAWSTRIVVGKVGTQATPLLTETMKYITVNPTWNVPPSIIRNEYLPALQRDPNALARIGLKVTHNNDGSIRVYQPPGERNALGRIRFNFPNRFLVYQHDTPDKHLFAHDKRAYSHGCMRVQNPDQYAEVLLSITQPDERYSAERIRKMFGSSERTINLKTHIPVHLTYQTAFVDDGGQLQTRADIYGLDKAVLGLLRGARGADTPVARNHHSGNKPVMATLPGRSADAPDRRLDGFFNRPGPRGDRFSRSFEHGGSNFYAYPRRNYGIVE